MISNLLNQFMDLYKDNPNPRVDSSSRTHVLLCSEIPMLLKKQAKLSKYYIKGSEGNGNRTPYPWVCLMNDAITRSPQKGLYIAILFKKDMSGFYLTLNQGITFFKDTFKKEGYRKADEAAKYFRSEINNTEFLSSIHIGGVKPDNGYGFEKTTIIGKLFNKNSFSDQDLYSSLNELSDIYDEIIDIIDGANYESIIPKLISGEGLIYEGAEKAIDDIKEVIYKGKKPVKHILVETVPKVDRPKRFKKISTPSNRKIDYVTRAQDNAETGLLGEKLVLEYEVERLTLMGLDKYAEKVSHVSLENDVFGYDIRSYNLDQNGKVYEIYIEVKTTSALKDSDFYVSRNEVVKSKELAHKYWLYRVFNCNVSGGEVKFYRVSGAIEDNFNLEPETYKASLKKGANVISGNAQIIDGLLNTLSH